MNDLFGADERSRLVRWGGWVLVVLALFLAVETLGSLKKLTAVDPVFNSISISGEGEVLAVPDIATFSFSVSADAKDVSEAQRLVTEKMNAIISALKEAGIEEKDIKTTDYSVWPKYVYAQGPCTEFYCPPGRQVPDGYTASHNISLKARETGRVGEILALVGEKGATNISSISFIVDDEEVLREEARSLAIRDAREKAKKLSKDLGVRLVRVISYYDNNGRVGPYFEATYGMGGDMMKASPAPTIPSGENKIKASVTVTYEIR